MLKRIFALCVLSFVLFVGSGITLVSALELPWIDKETVLEVFGEENQIWEPQEGVYMVADILNSTAYLVNPDGSVYDMRILSGQKRWVRYIGLSYYAATPIAEWKILSEDIKGDRVTFGNSGRFLRLYKKDGENYEYSHYGIHPHRDFDYMASSGEFYRSYGCVIAAEENIDLIEKAWKLNGEELIVKTVEGSVGL